MHVRDAAMKRKPIISWELRFHPLRWVVTLACGHNRVRAAEIPNDRPHLLRIPNRMPLKCFTCDSARQRST